MSLKFLQSTDGSRLSTHLAHLPSLRTNIWVSYILKTVLANKNIKKIHSQPSNSSDDHSSSEPPATTAATADNNDTDNNNNNDDDNMSCPFIHAASAPNPSSPATGNGDECPIKNSFSKLLTFMQSSPDAAFLLSREGKIIYRNKAASLLFLANVDGAAFTSLFTFSSPDGKRELNWDELVKDLSTTEPDHHDVSIHEADGMTLGFRVNLVRLSKEVIKCEHHFVEGMDLYASAYVTPLHDHQGDDTIREEGEDGEEEELDGCKSSSGLSISKHQRTILDGQDIALTSHMRDIVQSSLDPMLSLFENGTIWMVNDRTVEILGYSQSQLIGKNISQICPQAITSERKVRRTDSADDESTIGRIKHATVTHSTGKLLPVELGISRLCTSSFENLRGEPIYFAHIKDLSAFEEHKAQIAHKDDLCQAMINASFDPMFGIDQRGQILVCNQAACSMFGYTQEEFLKNNISIICNPRDAEHHDKHMARYIRTGEKRVIGRKRPLVARRKDGSQFHIELGVSEVNLSNGEKMFCGYVRDMTQQRLDKMNLRKKEAVIHDKFFNCGGGGEGELGENARSGARREVLRGKSMPGRKLEEALSDGGFDPERATTGQ